MDGQRMWYICTMKYCSVIKKDDEIMPFAATWMNPEKIILRKSDGERQCKYI